MTQKTHQWCVYMIRSQSGSLYTGITTDIQRRFQEHASQGPKCAKYLRGKGPLELVFVQSVVSKQEALRLEMQIKSLKKFQKEALIKAA